MFRVSEEFAMNRRHAFSLVEVMISTLLVGVLLVAALRGVGSVVRHRDRFNNRTRALVLANDLLSEILEKSYEDEDSPEGLGVESDEDSTIRLTFDDIDDYDDWSSLPPEDRQGGSVPNASVFRRSVSVVYLDPQDLAQEVVVDQGVKRVRIVVSHDGVDLATVDAIRSRATDEMVQP